jgi:hypothetical protein
MRAIRIGHYVVTVLLAVMLVKEDMKVCDESVRQILQEGGRLGEMLREDM